MLRNARTVLHIVALNENKWNKRVNQEHTDNNTTGQSLTVYLFYKTWTILLAQNDMRVILTHTK